MYRKREGGKGKESGQVKQPLVSTPPSFVVLDDIG